ncbi:hypothetical protein BBJ28_00011792 [Nothophytophthora sp. Chile5]|nr:hypothetical protein BBJ28_00011792 [Nothophytophthora sp. Chile5]
MQRSRRRVNKFRPAPLKPREKLQEADSYCVACGSRQTVEFQQPSRGGAVQRGEKLVKCQNCGVTAPNLNQPKLSKATREEFVPLTKVSRYLPIATDVFAHVVAGFGFLESLEGVMESVRVMQTHAKDDDWLVQRLVSIRRVLTPTAAWIQEDAEADRDDERRKELEQQALYQKQEDERRDELEALENAKKVRLRAKKTAMGLDPSVERLPLLLDVPPPVVAARENARLELRIDGKYVHTFRWFFNGRPLETEELVTGVRRSTLVISKLTKRVAGEYFCKCENEEGVVNTPTCRVTLAALRFSRLASKKLSSLPSSAFHPCGSNAAVGCIGSRLLLCDTKSLAPEKMSPPVSTELQALAWDPTAKVLVASSAPTQQQEAVQLFFYSLEYPSTENPPLAPQTTTTDRRLSTKPKASSFSPPPKFQLVDVHAIDTVSEARAIEFLVDGRRLLVSDMKHRVALYGLSLSFTCLKVFDFESDFICHLVVNPQPPLCFATAFRGKSFVKLFQNTSDRSSKGPDSWDSPAHRLDFKFPVHRVSFDASGFFLATAESGFMKTWLTIANVQTKNPSNRRFLAHVGKVTGLQWTKSTSLLISSGYDGYVKVWDPVAMSGLLSVHLDECGIQSMAFMDETSVLLAMGYTERRLQSHSVLQLAELEASRLVEMNAQAATIQKIWKGRRTRELIAQYIKAPTK